MPKFEIKKIINQLLANLSDRSRDIILSRFGIGLENYQTLEAIGQKYGITRERVRQIEADALKRIKNPANEVLIKSVNVGLAEFIKIHGGVMQENMLKAEFAANHFETKPEPSQKYEGAIGFFLKLDKNFFRLQENDSFRPRWAVDMAAVKNQENLTSYLLASLKKERKVVNFETLLSLAKKYNPALNNEVISAYLAPVRSLSQNVFSEWGLLEWPEIMPRGVRDKAFLIMQRLQKPLHFTEVAKQINEVGFSERIALPQTVHNELIKDERFVLVGRGLYALKDWGYQAGTVKDVIKSVLTSNGPLTRDEVIKAVLAKRMVKPGTILLNLNSFKKRTDNKYTLV